MLSYVDLFPIEIIGNEYWKAKRLSFVSHEPFAAYCRLHFWWWDILMPASI